MAEQLAMAVYRIGLKSDNSYDKLGLIFGDGSKPTDEQIERLAGCFNALSGVPDALLPDVKRAIAFYKMQEHLFNTGRLEFHPSESVEAGIRLHERNREYFPTELHGLIDSLKE